MKGISTRNLKKGWRRASLLVEATVASVLMLAIAAVLLRMTLTTIKTRQWGIVQGMVDSYLTYEVAYASKIPFSVFEANGSDFPLQPNFSTTTATLGSLPNGTALTGTVYRSRYLNALNSTGADSLSVTSYNLRVIVKYQLDGRTYYKTRTVTRVQ